jgi:hypothetical protein
MIKTEKELELKVKDARLLTKAELEEYGDYMPKISSAYCWWLADVDETDEDYVAYAEGKYTEEDMFCNISEPNTWIIAALDIECANIKAGDEFIHCGYVFTALSEKLAVSNNFLGCAKYYDEEAGYGVNEVIYTMIKVDSDK